MNKFCIMSKLPKNFPEYSLLHKTLRKRILELKKDLSISVDPVSQNKIIKDIEKYQNELEKIKSYFPEQFFDNL